MFPFLGLNPTNNTIPTPQFCINPDIFRLPQPISHNSLMPHPLNLPPTTIIRPLLPPNDLIILFQITNNLTCRICNKYFSDPITTACNHTFCRSCLNGLDTEEHTCPDCTSPTLPLHSSILVQKLSNLIAKLSPSILPASHTIKSSTQTEDNQPSSLKPETNFVHSPIPLFPTQPLQPLYRNNLSSDTSPWKRQLHPLINTSHAQTNRTTTRQNNTCQIT